MTRAVRRGRNPPGAASTRRVAGRKFYPPAITGLKPASVRIRAIVSR